MKTLSFAVLIIVSLVFSSCSSSTRTNGPLADYSIVVKPKAGSIFVYQQNKIDTNGKVLPGLPRTDSVFTLIAADTTMMGRSNVWLFMSGEFPGGSYTGEYYAIAYLDNGDLDYWEPGLQNLVTYWIRLPIATHRESDYVLDTTIDGGLQPSHERDSMRVAYIGDVSISTGSGRLQAKRLSFTIATAESFEGSDTTHYLTTRIMDFVPSIGFFSRFETQYAERDSISASFYGERMMLTRYEQK